MPAPASASRRGALWILGIVIVIASVPGPLMGTVVAQEPTTETLELKLVDQPVWQRPEDPLDLRVRLTNRGITSIEGFLISLTAHPPVTTRSGLHQSFAGNAGATASATSLTFEDEIAPGGSSVVAIDESFGQLSSLSQVTDGGVYPLTISVSDAVGAVEHDSLTTPLILYPEEPDVPLNLSVLVPINDVPSRGADGVFRDPLGEGNVPIEDAVGEDGWLTGLVAAFEEHAGELPDLERTVRVPPRRGGRNRRPRLRTISVPQRGLHLGVAATPRFVEELADVANGYRRGSGEPQPVNAQAPVPQAARDALARLGALLGEDGIQTILTPYSFPDVPALARHDAALLEPEIDEALEVMAEELDMELQRDWLFAPAGRLGARSLAELRFTDPDTARFTVFQPSAFDPGEDVEPEGCPQSFASFTCPVSVRTAVGPTTGLVGDEGLQDRLVALVQGGGALELQNFFAETAAIRQELPSIADRVAQVTIPSLWHPSPGVAEKLFSGLRSAPWLRTVTPAEAVELTDPSPRSDELTEEMAELSTDPGDELFADIAETNDLIERFRRLRPPEQMIDRLRRNSLVAASRMWWPSPELTEAGRAYLEGTRETIAATVGRVTIAGPDEINLTSQEGEIPLVVTNGTDFPTTVRIRLESPRPDLALDPSILPAQRVASGESFQFTVEADARSSGIFPMEVVIETPDQELEIATKRITIRSTAFNRIALGVTLGAFGFLVFFYLVRLVRRRRNASS